MKKAKSIMLVNLNFKKDDRITLEEYVTSSISNHSALDHPLFHFICGEVKNKSLTKKQYEFFRHIMFSRVCLTLPSITTALHSALTKADFDSVETCFQNLCEELSFGSNGLGLSHPQLMEKAFNYIGNKFFNLENRTLLECFRKPIISEEIIYHSTILRLYKEYPLVVSLAQEISSGGIMTGAAHGMMEQLYKIFLGFSPNFSDSLKISEYKNEVLPYFSAHLTINEKLEIIHDGTGVEYLHGERAKKDYLRNINSLWEIERDLPYLFAFLDAQKYLFDKTLTILEKLGSE